MPSRISRTLKGSPSVLVMLRMAVVGVPGAEDRRQLTEAVEAFVVHFDHEDLTVTAEDPLKAVGQRVDVADVQVADHVAVCVGAFDGFSHGTESRSPTNHQRVTFLIAEDFGSRQFAARGA